MHCGLRPDHDVSLLGDGMVAARVLGLGSGLWLGLGLGLIRLVHDVSPLGDGVAAARFGVGARLKD